MTEYREFTLAEAHQALTYIPSDERETWVSMAMAIKSEFGDAGFDVWNEWSQRSPKYKLSSARSVWRSVKGVGGIGIGTLIKEAKNRGWQRATSSQDYSSAYEDRREAERAAKQRQEQEERETLQAQHEAELKAKQFVSEDTQIGSYHSYMESKGHGDVSVLVDRKITSRMIVPIFSKPGNIVAYQSIDSSGVKKFGPVNCRTSGCYHAIGYHSSPDGVWFCEGLADGHSIWKALKRNMRDRELVVVCFTAYNLKKVAASMFKMFPRVFKSRNAVVMADADPAGFKGAKGTRLPIWVPVTPKADANSYHFESLVDDIREIMNINTGISSKTIFFGSQNVDLSRGSASYCIPNENGEYQKLDTLFDS